VDKLMVSRWWLRQHREKRKKERMKMGIQDREKHQNNWSNPMQNIYMVL